MTNEVVTHQLVLSIAGLSKLLFDADCNLSIVDLNFLAMARLAWLQWFVSSTVAMDASFNAASQVLVDFLCSSMLVTWLWSGGRAFYCF